MAVGLAARGGVWAMAAAALLWVVGCVGTTPTAKAPIAPTVAAPTVVVAIPTAAPTMAAKATEAPTVEAKATVAATPRAPATRAPAPTATAVPTQASPAGLRVGPGVQTAAEVDALTLGSGTVEVVFWHIFTSNQEQGLKEIIAQFEKEQPNIRVIPVYKGMYDVTRKATLTAIAANAVPDMVWSFPYAVSEYAREGVVQPLDPFMASAKHGLGDLAQATPKAIPEAYRYVDFGGATLSLPPAVSADVMYYNADWLKLLGYARPPATWEEFAEICAKVKATSPEKFCTALLPDANRFVSHVFARGGDLLTPDGKAASFRQAGLETLKWYDTMFKMGYAYQPAQQFGDQADFGLGKVLFTFGTSTGVPFYRRVVEDPATKKPRFDWSFAPFPHTTREPVVHMFGPSAAILKTTPERSLAAWTFLKYWMGKEASGTWAIQSNYYPVNRNAVTTGALQTYLAANPVYAQGFDLFQYGRTEPTLPGWQTARGALVTGMTAVMSSKATPEEAIGAIIEATNKALGP